MNRWSSGFGMLFVTSFLLLLSCCFEQPVRGKPMKIIESVDDVKTLFPTTVSAIQSLIAQVTSQARDEIGKLIAIPADQRTFENTAKKLDEITSTSDFSLLGSVLQGLDYSSPDEAIRKAAHDGIITLENFAIDTISSNKKLYQAFKSYAEGNAKKESLNDEERFFITESMKDFKRAGLDLPDDKLEELKRIKKELSELTLSFNTAISADDTKITVSKEGLQGLDDHFINNLSKTDEGNYLLGLDYPTYFKVMEKGAVEDTRKRLYKAFQNRAYPQNDTRLKQIIAKRDELARLIGFEAYNALDLEDQMAKTPARAEAFLYELLDPASNKEEAEIMMLKQELPESVTLTEEGKIKPWDMAYLVDQYKKKHFDVDEGIVAEYFPMENTIKELLDIYRTFLSIDFVEVPVQGFWHPDVKLVQVYNKERTKLLGYLILDLFPRPNKFSHAAHSTIVPAIKYPNGQRSPTVSLVWANFPKSTAEKPSLLQRSDVKTFFHEFGHAMHALLGATTMGSFSGTAVKRDFVELPSQMLEEWLDDKEILKKISRHYKTGEPLPDATIDNIIGLKKVFSGNGVKRQIVLSLLSLLIYGPGKEKNPYELTKELQERYIPSILFDPENHFYASFGHLMGYGSKYYGYLWSRVFAQDVFEQIKREGLLNPVVGQKYINEIIGKGGSQDPDVLLKNFLGRAPNQDAYLRAMGFSTSGAQKR